MHPADGAHYAPYPALTGAEGYPSCAGSDSAWRSDMSGNQAFTQWLCCLSEGVVLTEAACARLHDLWRASGLPGREWETLSAEQQVVICALWQQKQGDWQVTFSTRSPAEAWNRLCRGELVTHQSAPFDMLQLCPPRLDVEINGYNGRLLAGVPDGFSDTTDRCGTKWPHAHDLNISWSSDTTFDADFDTPWSGGPDGLIMNGLQVFPLLFLFALAGGFGCGALVSVTLRRQGFMDEPDATIKYPASTETKR
ncbi:MAG: DUF1281 domain-containing protein [Pantoea sp.]|uniref:DUF1281 domain-containing protein n=1 Tax=Pantoea sp. TaxID=69393 RepID=UPI0039E42DD7